MDDRSISKMLTDARARVLQEYPFFGRLLLKLSFGTAQCGTAFTDMRRIVFDPVFVGRLSADEIKFVLVHEVLHCVLKHCTRSSGKQHFVYNIACDIVVNSTMLEMYRRDDIIIDGEPLMHLAPNGREGREYTAEEIYNMLMKMTLDRVEKLYGGGTLDNHAVWEELHDATLEDIWNHHLREAVAACKERSGVPQFLERYLKEIDRSPRTNWRQVLHDFIRFDRGDYDFSRPDNRYAGDILLPSFCEEMDGGKVERLWFFADTSGSVSDEAVSVAYEEIKQATVQIGNLSGMLSYFDCTVSDPVAFESLEDIASVRPVGGGGTSFRAVFEKVKEYAEQDESPNVIIIITDGYDEFPEEEAALGIPVIWIIVDSEVVPPWGTYAFIST